MTVQEFCSVESQVRPVVVIRSWVALIEIRSENEVALSSEAVRQTKVGSGVYSCLRRIGRISEAYMRLSGAASPSTSERYSIPCPFFTCPFGSVTYICALGDQLGFGV